MSTALKRLWQGPHSVRTWLVAQFLVVMSMASVVVTLMFTQWRMPMVEFQAWAEQVRAADMAEHQVEVQLDLAQRQVMAMAGMVAMGGERPGVPEAMFASLRELPDRTDGTVAELFQGIYWLDAEFRLKDMAVRVPAGSTTDHWMGNDFSGLDVVKAVGEARQLVWSDHHNSPVLGVPVVSVAMPAGSGYVLAELSVDQLTRTVTGSVALDGLLVLVLDSRAELIAAPDMSLAQVRTNLSHWPVMAAGLSGQSIQGEIDFKTQRYIGTTRNLSRLNWVVFAGFPTSLAETARQAALLITFVTVLVAVSVGVVLFTRFASTIRRRMQLASGYAHTVAGGRYDAPAFSTGIVELDELDNELGKMAKTIERRERQLRSIVDTTPMLAIQWFDRSGRVVDWNPASEQVLGWTKAEALGKQLDQLVYTAEQQADFMAVLADIERTGQPFGPYSGDVKRRSGEMRTILSTTFSVPDVDGGLLFVCMDVDITDLKRTEAAIRASEHKFNLFFQVSPVAVAVMERVGERFVHVDVNQSWERLIGLSKAEAVAGQFRLTDLLENKDINSGYLQQATLGKVGNLEQSWLVRPDGRRFLAEGAVARLAMDGRDLMLYSLHDVTEPWHMREALQTLNAELEERIAKRTEKLTQANQDLAEAFDRLKEAQERLVQADKLASLGALVAGVAHEMNTPIGNGLMAVSTLAQRTTDLKTQMSTGIRRSDLERYLEQVEMAADISMRNLGRAAELVSSFKRVAVDQTSSQRRGFKFDELVYEIVLTLQPTLKHTPFKLQLSVPEGIVCDSYPGPLGQVLTNLIQNAVVHAFQGRSEGWIRIHAQLDGDVVELVVADNGSGIAPEHRAKVFDPFFTTRMGQGGSGLGLHIVYSLVTGLLGGNVQVFSETGAGTRMVVRFPVVAPYRVRAVGTDE